MLYSVLSFYSIPSRTQHNTKKQHWILVKNYMLLLGLHLIACDCDNFTHLIHTRKTKQWT